MKLSKTYRMQFKRRRSGRTDYKKRLVLLTSRKPRLVVRKSLNYIRAQIVDFDIKGDKTLISANSRELKKIGWNFACDNIPAAYLTGLAIGKSALAKNINEVILDTGFYKSTKGNKIYALAKGVKDAGVNIPLSEEVVPSEDRISGKHVAINEKFKELPDTFIKLKEALSKGGEDGGRK